MTQANDMNKILGVDAKNDNDERASRTIDVTMGSNMTRGMVMGSIDNVMMCRMIYNVTIGKFTIGVV